jgi:hypothetical protein
MTTRARTLEQSMVQFFLCFSRLPGGDYELGEYSHWLSLFSVYLGNENKYLVLVSK